MRSNAGLVLGESGIGSGLQELRVGAETGGDGGEHIQRRISAEHVDAGPSFGSISVKAPTGLTPSRFKAGMAAFSTKAWSRSWLAPGFEAIDPQLVIFAIRAFGGFSRRSVEAEWASPAMVEAATEVLMNSSFHIFVLVTDEDDRPLLTVGIEAPFGGGDHKNRLNGR